MSRSREAKPCISAREGNRPVPNSVITLKWYSTAEVATMLGYGLTKTKHLVLSGQIRSVKDGGHRKILPEWVDDYIRHKVAEDEVA
jgi:excisionase family DNA binding protein